MKQEENHFADADPKGRYPANVMHDGSDVVKIISTDKKKVFQKKIFLCPKTSRVREKQRKTSDRGEFTAKPMEG